MKLLDQSLLWIHVAAGFLSLLCFLIPIFAKKGKELHIRVGKLYVKAMWVVVITAALLSIINLYEGKYISAIFLGYLSILTSNPLWFGIAVLKYKFDFPVSFLIKKIWYERVVFILGLLNILTFFYLSAEGFAIVLLIFGLLGLTSAPKAFSSLDKLKLKVNSIHDHINDMISTGIAAYTAFLVFGGSRLFPEYYSGNAVIIFWVLPGILGAFLIAFYQRKYKTQPMKPITA